MQRACDISSVDRHRKNMDELSAKDYRGFLIRKSADAAAKYVKYGKIIWQNFAVYCTRGLSKVLKLQLYLTG